MQTWVIKAYKSNWLLPLIGFMALFIPTYWDLSQDLWLTEEQTHGPMVLLISIWLLRKCLIESNITFTEHSDVINTENNANILGSFFLGLGLAFYIVGRSQEMLVLEVSSEIPIIAGTLWLLLGKKIINIVWFPLFFLLFMVPLPGIIIDSFTAPLKQWISYCVEHILYPVGFPIARQGVVLMIGQYQLLVADACSGLNSMFSLGAIGVLYMYLMARKSKIFNVIMIVSIIPIAILSNILRIISLVLITYYFGDEVGQGFLHGFASIVLFSAALGCFFLLDFILGLIIVEKVK
ncbi:exosortase B [Methylomonas sp. AM2-LC]|uniref:exosortase B n=1 Tax=Methylomonas sp. AM2-LC TaxID=3153301 RepID=UPI0032635026